MNNTRLRQMARAALPPARAITQILTAGRGDRELTKLFLSGTDADFSRLHEALKGSLLSYALRRLRDRESAEDVVQEVFLKLHRFRESFDRSQSFSAWFWTLARNTVLDSIRASASRAFVADSDPDELPSTLDNAEKISLLRSSRRILLSHLQSLTRLQRKVLWLCFVHGLSHQEIARKLGLSIGAVKCLTQRARNALRIELGPSFALAF